MLTVITGPMFSGKTSTLISFIKAHTIAGDKILAVKPSRDDRYGEDSYTTHDGQKLNVVSVENARDI